MVLVALPMSPCALIPQICRMPAATAAEAVPATTQLAVHPRSCCSSGQEAGDASQSKSPVKPCARGCCKLTPIGPKVESVSVAPVLLAATYFPAIVVDLTGADSGLVIVPPDLPAETLHTLSCLWRC